MLGLGVWQMAEGRETEQAVEWALEAGYRHIDTATYYRNERSVGAALRRSGIPREQVFVTTKWLPIRRNPASEIARSLERLGLEYVDLFYSHRFDPQTPLEETMGALDSAVRQGKALYVGISSHSAEKTRAAAAILRMLGTPLLIHQPSYSMLNRWIEPDLLDALEQEGVGCIGFSPLAQGMLTDKYLDGIPEGSRASEDTSLSPKLLTEETLARIRSLNEIATGRGQTLAQMALAWTLRDPRITSTLVGASSVAQLEANVAALDRLDFTADELTEIDRYAIDSDINIWAASSAV